MKNASSCYQEHNNRMWPSRSPGPSSEIYDPHTHVTDVVPGIRVDEHAIAAHPSARHLRHRHRDDVEEEQLVACNTDDLKFLIHML